MVWTASCRLPLSHLLGRQAPPAPSQRAAIDHFSAGFQARTAATALRSEDYGYGAEATPLRSKLSSTVKPFLQHNGKLKETLHLLDQHELQPDFSIFASLLGECSRGKILTDGRRIHSHIIRSALDRKMFLGNLLIKMYGICGDPVDAQAVFNRMPSRNVITWTLIMDAYIQHGDHMEAIHVYQEMHRAGVKPNSITLVSILTASSLHQGKMIHACVVEYGFERDVILGTALINMYQKCGCLESARQLFDRMGSRDVIAWNTLIAAYIHHGKFDDSIHLYLQMQQNVEPNHVSFISVLGACCSPAMVLQGLSFHACIVENGVESDVAIGAALVTMYGKCKSAEDAQSVFEKVHPRNVILWNAMITAYAESGHDSEALCLYEQMKGQEVKPNHVTFINALSASAALASLSHGMDIHGSIISHSLESQTLVGTALFNMYGKCGCIKSARRVFDKLLFQDLVMWNAMLSVYILNGHAKEAFQLYHQMLGDNMVPDRFTFNTLLSACCRPAALRQGQGIHSSIIMYGVEGQAGVGAGLVGMYNKCGSVEAARSAFERQHRKDLALWNTMLTGYMQCNLGKEAILLYQKMGENSVKPDGFTFSAVLGACSSLAALAQGKEIHAAVVDGGYDSECAVKNALVHMYSKCGNMADAWSVFEKHHDQDVISWNAMISGYAQHGYGKEALQVYRKMQTREIKANNVTFVGVFSACAHVGLVEEGLEYFDSMKKVSGITPGLEHYACIVDLFGRVGRIEEAEEFLNQIPIQPDVVVWKVLLGSCKVHNDIRRGRGAAEHAVEYDSENTQAYVLLSNIYAAYEDLSWTGLELEEGLATMQLDYT